MSGNLPPGSDTSRAPWNDTPAPDCRECGGYYAEDGHEDGCPEEGRDAQDYEEAQKAHQAEMKMDERRLNDER